MNETWLLAVQDAPRWMEHWFNVSSPWEVWWLALGVIAQAIFLGRWIVQWVASERRGESVVPTVFWWSSIVGATLLLVYFIGRREPVGVMGQAFGWAVYGRNLYLIRTSHGRALADPLAGPPYEADPPAASENRQSPA